MSQPALQSLSDHIAIARPTHWLKNGLVLLGAGLAMMLHTDAVSGIDWRSAILAVIATSLIASAYYILNEILDVAGDRQHPVKRSRPLAVGRIATTTAGIEAVGLAVVGIAIAAYVNLPVLMAVLFMLLLGMLYNIPPVRLKERPYVDLLCEGLNSPIRILIGWFAVLPEAAPDPLMLLAFWMAGSASMALKRWMEYRSFPTPQLASAYRRSFGHYTSEKLVTCIMTCSGLSLFALALMMWNMWL